MPLSCCIPSLLLLLTAIFSLAFGLPHALEERAPSGAVIASNFPDPAVIQVGSTWYAFATRTKGSTIHIQIAKSTDFNTWAIVNNADGSQKDAMPTLPAWVNSADWATWAPSVAQISSTRFVMYFSAITNQDKSGRFHCVGYATASNIEGPYTGPSTAAICPLSQGGAIDPSAYQGPAGQRYIVYKVDGNSIGNGGPCGNTVAPIKATPIMLQRVASDGVTFQGPPTQLLNNRGAADDGIIEAPAISQAPNGGAFFLFFSSGCFTTRAYTVSYATAPQPWGPWTRQSTPLFRSGDSGLSGPGGADIASDGTHMVFHAFRSNPSDFFRQMHTANLTYNGTTVTA